MELENELKSPKTPIWIDLIAFTTLLFTISIFLRGLVTGFYLSFVVAYSITIIVILLIHAGYDFDRAESPLVSYLVSKLFSEKESVEGQIKMSTEDTESIGEVDIEKFHQGVHDGFPVISLLLLFSLILIASILNVSNLLILPNQIYGITHSAAGGLIMVRDRFREPPGSLIMNSRTDGQGWIEAICGFSLLSIGFLLQALALAV